MSDLTTIQAASATIYLGGGTHGFPAGHQIKVPAAHAQALDEAGLLVKDTAPVVEPAAAP